MNDKRKEKKPPESEESFFEMDDLPPMDQDEPETSDPEDFAIFLTPNEPLSPADGDALGTDDDFGLYTNNEDLIDDADDRHSFVETWEAKPPLDFDLDMVEETESFTEDKPTPALDDLGGDWFLNDDDEVDSIRDKGESGPLKDPAESFEIDESAWAKMDREEDDEDEEIIEAMERLGIDYQFAQNTAPSGACLVLETQFLGPDGGGVTTVIFEGSSLMAAGESLYALGADGMFHTAWSENQRSMGANSIALRGDTVFLGTNETGAMVTRDGGRHFSERNTWFTQGLSRTVQASSRQVSTPFRLFGQTTPMGYRLLGCTGRGQLFSSVDNGRTWRSLATPGQCLALAPCPDSRWVYAVARTKAGETAIFASGDADEWERNALPHFWPDLSLEWGLFLDGTGTHLLLATETPDAPAAFSTDKGATWHKVEGAGRGTAVALDPDDLGCMAAALYDPNTGYATITFSGDGGKSWQTVLCLENGESTKIHALAIHSGRTRRVAAVTRRGVYLVTLTRGGVSH